MVGRLVVICKSSISHSVGVVLLLFNLVIINDIRFYIFVVLCWRLGGAQFALILLFRPTKRGDFVFKKEQPLFKKRHTISFFKKDILLKTLVSISF